MSFLANSSNVALSGDHNNLYSLVAAANLSVLCLTSFLVSGLYGKLSTANGHFRVVDDLSRGLYLLPSAQGLLGCSQHVGFFEIACVCILDIP